MIETLRLIREEYGFAGYIHAKAIPGADPLLTYRLGLLADRMSVNIELPSEASLKALAPDKTRASIPDPHGPDSGGHSGVRAGPQAVLGALPGSLRPDSPPR